MENSAVDRTDATEDGRPRATASISPARGDGWRAMRPTPVAVAQPVERPPETRGAAGSIPAGHIARRTRPTRSARGRTATGAVPRLENGWLSRAWGFDSLSFRPGSVAQQAELPALNRRVAGSTPAGALSRHRPRPSRPAEPASGPLGDASARERSQVVHVADRAPDAGVRRASPQDARRDARSEAWPSGKAAPCYGVGASSASAGSSPAASVPFRPVAQWKRAVGFEPTCRPFESGRGVSHHDRPRVAQLRRAPLLQRGGWGFESLTADTPLKLSSAEQPPCKRKAVGSIPTWGSSPPRSPTWQRHPAQTRTSRGSNPRGGTFGGGTHGSPPAPSFGATPPCGSASRPASRPPASPRRRPGRGVDRPRAGATPCPSAVRSLRRCDVVQWQDVRLLPGERWFDPSRRSCFPRSSNGRIFGSEPKDAWFESRPRSSIIRTRTWRPSGFQRRRRGFDSFRPCSTRPGRLVGQDPGLSHR